MAETQPSLRQHLLRQLLLPLTVVFVASSGLSYFAALHFAAEEYNRTLYDMVHSLAQQVRITTAGPVLDLPAIAEKLFLWDNVDITYYRVWGERSGQIAGYPELPPTMTHAEKFHGIAIGEAAVRGEEIRLATMTLKPDPRGETVYVQVGETQRKRGRLAQKVMVVVLLPQLVLILLVGFFINRGVRRGLEPLREIAARLEASESAVLEPIPEQGVPREVLGLTRALHQLLQRLDVAMATQSRFVADAAHQLRTPLTAIKLNLDHAMSEQTLESVRPALAQIRISADRAVRLSEQLLSLARVEHVGVIRAFEILDLGELVREVGSEWVHAATLHKVELGYEPASEPVHMRGNEPMLREMVSNLIDNAIKHGCPNGGAVTLSVDQTDRPLLRIVDDGPGIDPGMRDAVVQRFSRGDTGGDGAGLGLAIAVETARVHGGRLKLSDGPAHRGLAVTVEFPPVCS
jgi:two-component system sensor histidine kinase TctE